jgi:hypothetical protein
MILCGWLCLLSVSKLHHNAEMGECVAKQVLELDPANATGYLYVAIKRLMLLLATNQDLG